LTLQKPFFNCYFLTANKRTMTNEEHLQLVEIIHSEIEKLQGKANTLKDFTGPISPDDAIGHVSRIDAINNKSVFDASLRNIETRLEQL